MLKEFFMKCKETCHKAKLLYSDWAFLCMFSNDKKKAEVEVCFSLLRKDCHILDKGLHTVPFEKGHGKAFYAEAVSLKKNWKTLLSLSTRLSIGAKGSYLLTSAPNPAGQAKRACPTTFIPRMKGW